MLIKAWEELAKINNQNVFVRIASPVVRLSSLVSNKGGPSRSGEGLSLSPSGSNPTDSGVRRMIAMTGGNSIPHIKTPKAIHALRQPSFEINW